MKRSRNNNRSKFNLQQEVCFCNDEVFEEKIQKLRNESDSEEADDGMNAWEYAYT
jgi:hypothetical protein